MLNIAVPSKGRLMENAFSFFEKAGLTLQRPRGERDYRGVIKNLEAVEILFLSASEIAKELATGSVHFGVTGEDLIYENIKNAEQKVAVIAPLKFGYANVIVAVPQTWIDVQNMADLDDVAGQFRAKHGVKMRVATKYINLTRQFFKKHHISDYTIIESLGATEGAPASGAAELIVDITTTGSTLAANALKVLDDGVILKSEASLVASLTAQWGEQELQLSQLILDRIASEQRGRMMVEVASENQRIVVLKSDIFKTVEDLRQKGAKQISIADISQVFTNENPLFNQLKAKLA